ALRDHHDGEERIELADLLVGLEATLARHLLVEEDDAVRAPAQHLDRVIGVRRRVHLEALLAEEDPVGLEEIGFVVHPEDGFLREGHCLQSRMAWKSGQRTATANGRWSTFDEE